ncbi:hypothetical protein P280DRAFT_409747 [Massarina eburnea CBS 473.64]|uniref:Cupredoxin n=1 Tax=Massarina eburnea CBS 473.64 TaxID=1395130 RepID=A0A6A6RPZ9_9PLEO|nr:hypothetical protein P280DRAFT_409747 [Massarina eburnea CBS 473.64]
MISTFFIVGALATFPLAFGQYSYSTVNATPTLRVATSIHATSTLVPVSSGTGSSKPAIQTIAVGQNGLTFTPDTIHAKVGEQIVFEFFPKNHSVAQADFNTPCKPSNGGLFSGFIATPQGRANQSFTITVEDDKPIWLYCPQNAPRPHCAAGMVAVVNPPKSGPNTLDAFKLAAAKTNSTGSTAPTGGLVGGQISAPGSSSTPSGVLPSGAVSPSIVPFHGAANELAVSSVLGLIGVFAALLL